MPDRVRRVDVGQRIRADQRTPQGGARIPAAFSRTGVQVYPQADGTNRREYRPPDEVFSTDSLRTYDTATVTVGHPANVDASNWKEHAVGDARGAHQDGRFVAGDIMLRDRATLDRVDSGELQEISCGYDCMLEMKPGISPEGEHYDAIQREIRINHIGLGPSNWGRAGSDVRLRLDGGLVAYAEDGASPRPRAETAPMTPEQIAALQAQLEAAKAIAAQEKARADALEAQSKKTQADAATTEAAKLQAELDAAKGKLDALEKQTDPKRLDAAVLERVTIIDGARLLHGKADIAVKREDGTAADDKSVMVSAIVAREPDFKADGRSVDYIRSRFDFWVEQVKKAHQGLGNINRGTSPTVLDPAGRGDGNDAELAELEAHFDHAGERLAAYTSMAFMGEEAAQRAVDAVVASYKGKAA